jgi:parallel beta-helix repeat protein
MKIKKLTILAVAAGVAALIAVSPGQALAGHCDVIVTATASIQTAIDGASSGDVVCLDDSGGVFGQTVVFGPAASGITLSADDGDTPILDGASTILVNGIELDDGVSDVTIEDLEIRNYTGSVRASGISTWDVDTFDITVRRNYIHDNTWNGILVGSEGAFMHKRWQVEHNIVTDHTFIGIELTNCDKCKIKGNFVRNHGAAGIVVQARNSIGTGVSPVVDHVVVEENDVSGTTPLAGILLVVHDGSTSSPFPSTGGTVRLTKTTVKNNYVHNTSTGIWLRPRNVGATADLNKIENNTVVANTDDGIRLKPADGSPTVTGNKVNNNTATNNDGDGFEADTSGVNSFENNSSNANGGFGYNDVAGSSTYTNNQCNFNTLGGPSTPGLCAPQL